MWKGLVVRLEGGEEFGRSLEFFFTSSWGHLWRICRFKRDFGWLPHEHEQICGYKARKFKIFVNILSKKISQELCWRSLVTFLIFICRRRVSWSDNRKNSKRCANWVIRFHSIIAQSAGHKNPNTLPTIQHP